jgi:hypothetical protein
LLTGVTSRLDGDRGGRGRPVRSFHLVTSSTAETGRVGVHPQRAAFTLAFPAGGLVPHGPVQIVGTVLLGFATALTATTTVGAAIPRAGVRIKRWTSRRQ